MYTVCAKVGGFKESMVSLHGMNIIQTPVRLLWATECATGQHIPEYDSCYWLLL
jgi:hypothetical protein